MNEEEKRIIAEIIRGLDREELVQLLASVTHFPADVLKELKDALEKARPKYVGWY